MPPIHHLHVATAIAAFALLAPATRAGEPPASCDTPDLIDRASAWIDRAQEKVIAFKRSARDAIDEHVWRAQRPYGMFALQGPSIAGHDSWEPIGAASDATAPPRRVVVLIHGLDESGDVWRDLAPALDAHGHAVVRFDYPCNQAIAKSTDLLASQLRLLRSRGVEQIDIVAHSMGGLIARDVLTRPGVYAGDGRNDGSLPDVDRVIMLGTPHTGSPWACLEPLGQAINMADRAISSREVSALLGFVSEGDGQAGRDLMPRSSFLIDLNARGVPTNVRFISIVGSFPIEMDRVAARVTPWAARVLGAPRAALWTSALTTRTAQARAMLGDGVVSIGSASSSSFPALAGEIILVRAGHRGMITKKSPDTLLRGIGMDIHPAPAIPIILDRLERD
jgi:pimeloyl-ACP methyl ester carboxylesterase